MATRKAMAMRIIAITAFVLTWATSPLFAQTAVPVTIDNFVRAESDLYFNNSVSAGGFGGWHYVRELLTQVIAGAGC